MGSLKKNILIGVPCKNEHDNIPKFLNSLENTIKNLNDYNFTLLFVDDGSTDNTWFILSELSFNYKYIKAAKFTRNFGKESAIKFIINYSSIGNYDYMILLDADLQHPPLLIKDLIKKAISGSSKIILSKKINEKKSLVRSIFTSIFYKTFNFFSSFSIPKDISDYSILNRRAILLLDKLNDQFFNYKAAIQWLGLEYQLINFQVPIREFGKSNFNFLQLIKYSLKIFLSYNPSLIFKLTAFVTIIFWFLLITCLIISNIYFNSNFYLQSSLIIILIFFWLSIVFVIFSFFIFRISLNVDNKPSYIIDDFKN